MASSAKVYSPAACEPRWRSRACPRTSKSVSSTGPAVPSERRSSRVAERKSAREEREKVPESAPLCSVPKMRKRPSASVVAEKPTRTSSASAPWIGAEETESTARPSML